MLLAWRHGGLTTIPRPTSPAAPVRADAGRSRGDQWWNCLPPSGKELRFQPLAGSFFRPAPAPVESGTPRPFQALPARPSRRGQRSRPGMTRPPSFRQPPLDQRRTQPISPAPSSSTGAWQPPEVEARGLRYQSASWHRPRLAPGSPPRPGQEFHRDNVPSSSPIQIR